MLVSAFAFEDCTELGYGIAAGGGTILLGLLGRYTGLDRVHHV